MLKRFLIVWILGWSVFGFYNVLSPLSESPAQLSCVTTTRHGTIC